MPGPVIHEGNFDDSNDPLIQEWTRITDADMSVVWEGRSRDFNERLRNRWAAFTDAELAVLWATLQTAIPVGYPDSPAGSMVREVEAERERRRGAAS